MSERDDLMVKVQQILIQHDIPPDELRAELFLAFEPYEITQRSTELVVADEESIEKYIRLFLINKRVAGRTDRTLALYKYILMKFFQYCPKLPTEITADDIKGYLAYKEIVDGTSKVWVKNVSRVLSSFFQWMTREEYIVRNPFNKIEDIKLPKIKKAAFTEMDVEKLRSSIEPNDIRLLLIFELLLSTWCRASEISNIRISEFSENKDSVLVHGKGQKDRICYLNAKAKITLQRYLNLRNDESDWLFPQCKYSVAKNNEEGVTFSQALKKLGIKQKDSCNWWQYGELVKDEPTKRDDIESRIRMLGRKAGVEKTHPHRFRRTGATFALRRGMPIEQVSKLLGHESIETTQIYLDISERELEQGHRKYV